MQILFNFSSTIIQLICLLFLLWTPCLLLLGCFIKKQQIPNSNACKKFAVVVPAHNEAIVIGNLIESIKKSTYPSGLFDIYVIADNCTDNTAEVARIHGAIVHERFNSDLLGKGFALRWMLDKLIASENLYDALVVFDADNLVSKNYLAKINDVLCTGEEIIQGCVLPINYTNTLVSVWHSFFLEHNKLYNLSKVKLGFSSNLLGTGFCISFEVIKAIQFQTISHTEDLEYTMKLLLNDKKITYNIDAKTYDECATKLIPFWFQCKRWTAGAMVVFSKYSFAFIKKLFQQKKWRAIEVIVQTGWPIVSILCLLFVFIHSAFHVETPLYTKLQNINNIGFLFCIFIAPVVFLVRLNRKKLLNFKIIMAIITYPFYMATWGFCSLHALCTIKQKKWHHPLHTRANKIEELEEI